MELITMEQAKSIVDLIDNTFAKSKKKARVSTFFVSSKNCYTSNSHITVGFTSQVRSKLNLENCQELKNIKGLKIGYQDYSYITFDIDEEYTKGWNGVSVGYYHYKTGYEPRVTVTTGSSSSRTYSIEKVEDVVGFVKANNIQLP